MRKDILMLLLAVVSSNAMAAWVQSSGGMHYSYYYDPATISGNGNIAQMFTMYDYEKPITLGAGKMMSKTMQNEYHCKKEMFRSVTISGYSGNMGGGKVIVTIKGDDKWDDILPGKCCRT